MCLGSTEAGQINKGYMLFLFYPAEQISIHHLKKKKVFFFFLSVKFGFYLVFSRTIEITWGRVCHLMFGKCKHHSCSEGLMVIIYVGACD